MTSSADLPTGARATRPRRPDFFIVGQSKSGTTALYEILREHPQIYMPAIKEPVFMASDHHKGLWAMVRTRPRTLEDYLALFADAAPEQTAGEASSVYLWSQTAAANIAALQPRAKIIAILREPASFLCSLHLQMLQNRVETVKDFGTAMALEPARRQGKNLPRDCAWPEALLYSERVRYVEQLRRFHGLFGWENVSVVIYDDFRADNEGTVRGVLEFLGVDAGVAVQPREANPTVRLRSRQLDDLIHRASVGRGPVMRGVRVGIKAVTTRRLRHGALGVSSSVVYGEPRPADERLMLELRGRFKGEVQALSDYLGRDLVTLWGYGNVTRRG
jgi:Sulfotransferase family